MIWMSLPGRYGWGLACASLFGCSQDGFDRPSKNTDPAVEIEISKFWLDSDVAIPFEHARFGRGSADLSVTFVKAGAEDPTFDLAEPPETVMRGYGRFEGMREVYKRNVQVDSHGIHGVRTAVYRTDASRNHTNVWFFHQAKGVNGHIYVTEFAQWDWQSGNEDLSIFETQAWPQFEDLEQAHIWNGTMFSTTPALFPSRDVMQWLVSVVDIPSPTFGIEGCASFVFFTNEDPTLNHRAYIHPRHGLIEVVYVWAEAVAVENVYPFQEYIIPRDGFAVAPEHLPDIPLNEATTENDIAGIWEGNAVQVDGGRLFDEVQPGQEETFPVTLELILEATNYRAEAGIYDILGGYTDPDFERQRTLGKFHLAEDHVRLTTDGGPGWAWLQGRYNRSADQLEFSMWRTMNSDFEGNDGGKFEAILMRVGGSASTTPSSSGDCKFNGAECAVFDGLVAELGIVNDLDMEVRIVVWSPDTGEPEQGFIAAPLQEGPTGFDLGDDWGIQAEGFDVHTIEDVGEYTGGFWMVVVSNLM